jgi:hypothetical protein
MTGIIPIGGAPEATLPLRSLYISDDALVLQARSIRAGKENRSCFADDVWDLSPANHREVFAGGVIAWTKVENPSLRLPFKEYTYARLNRPLGKDRPWKVATAYTWVVGPAVQFVRFVTETLEIGSLTALTPDMLNSFGHWVRSQPWSKEHQSRLLGVPRDLHRYNERISYERIGFQPWKGRRGGRAVTHGPRSVKENSTPRVPEDLMGPFLNGALIYVREFAPEILDAFRRHVRVIEEAPEPNMRQKRPILPRLEEYAERLRAEGRGVPDLNPYNVRWYDAARARAAEDPTAFANFSWIATEGLRTDSSAAISSTYKDWVAALIEEVGLEGVRAQRERPGSLVALLGHGLYGLALKYEIRHLISACYAVVTYLSGMRPSESVSLRPGCCRTELSEDGSVPRLKIAGMLYKHQEETGVPETWVVIEPVHEAIRVLEELHGIAGTPTTESLFTKINLGEKESRAFQGKDAEDGLCSFRDHLNELAIRPGRVSAVPDHAGKPWYFTSTQFRRTLAWYIVHEPFGVVAGAIQYKHAEIATMQGYAGTGGGGFRDEVVRTRMRRNLTLAREMYEARKRGNPTGAGAGAAAVDAELDAIRAELGDFPGAVAVDDVSIMKRLKSIALMLHAGIMNDCMYREETAACRAWQVTPAIPVFSRCRPDLCPNSRIERRHRPVWERAHANAEALLGMPRGVTANQTAILEHDRDRYRRVLDELDALIEEHADEFAQT